MEMEFQGSKREHGDKATWGGGGLPVGTSSLTHMALCFFFLTPNSPQVSAERSQSRSRVSDRPGFGFKARLPYPLRCQGTARWQGNKSHALPLPYLTVERVLCVMEACLQDVDSQQCSVWYMGGGGMKGGGAIKVVYVCRVVLPGVHTGLSFQEDLVHIAFPRTVGSG